MTIEIALHWYAAGAVFMLAWMAIIDERAREAAYVMLLWPLFLAVILALCMEKCTGWTVRLVRRREGLSSWGMRRPSDGRRGFGLRCQWCELQVVKAQPNDGWRD